MQPWSSLRVVRMAIQERHNAGTKNGHDLHFFTYLMLGPFFAAGEGLPLFTYRPLGPRTLPAPASCSRSADGVVAVIALSSVENFAAGDTLSAPGLSGISGAVAVSQCNGSLYR